MNAPHLIHLRARGVSVVLDSSGDRVPALLHWGRALSSSSAALETLAELNVMPTANSTADLAMRVGLLPAHHEGWMGRLGIAAHRDGRHWSPDLIVTGVRLDGRRLLAGATNAGAALVQYDLLDQESGLAVTLDVEMTPSGLFRARATLMAPETSADELPFDVEEVTLVAPVPLEASELMDFAGHWGLERMPVRGPLRPGSHVRENRRGRSGHDSAFQMIVGRPGFGFRHGEVWASHVAFSGNHRHVVERLGNGIQTLGGGEVLMPGEVRLRPGEQYESPWVYWAYGREGLDEVAARFHEHVRSQAQHTHSSRPVVFNAWEAVYFDHRPAQLVDLAHKAADIGVERFVLDDGWFRGRTIDTRALGDWYVDEERWPDGLHPLVDAVKARGMQFGLWVEPEMVNIDSEIVRSHPDWVMRAAEHRLPLKARNQHVLDLTNPTAYAYIRERIVDLVTTYDVDYLKWDHNRDLLEAGSPAHGNRAAIHSQTRSLYRLLAELRQRFPALEIESCSAGGARIDLGIAPLVDRFWASDNHDALDRQTIQLWTQQLIPPEMMGAHIARPQSTTTGRTQSIGFRGATALFGHMGVEWDVSTAEQSDLDQLRQWFALYKKWRGLLHGGVLVRADLDDDSRLVFGVVAPDRSRALFAVVGLTQSRSGVVGRVRFPGLDESAEYTLSTVAAPPYVEHWRNAPWLGQLSARGQIGDLTGELLGEVGLPAPALQPESAVLLSFTRTTHP